MIQSKSHRQIISLLTLTFIVTNRYTFCNPKNNITKLFYLHKIKNFYYPNLFQTSWSNLLFITDRSRVDAILNILLASKESKRARVLVSETSGRADGWKSLQLESPWNNPIFRVYHCSFLRSDPTSKWMHNDISHLLVEMERFYSLENAIFPWKEDRGTGGGGEIRVTFNTATH